MISCVLFVSLDDFNWIIIVGVNGYFYNLGLFFEIICFICCSRRDGCDDYIGEFNVVMIIVLDNCLDDFGDEVFVCGDGKKIEIYGVGDKCEFIFSILIFGIEF